MAYRKTYRRKYYRRRRYRRKADNFPVMGSGPSVLGWAARNAGKALGIATKVAGMVNSELKYSDNLYTGNISNAWSVYSLTNIAEGDDVSNRTGRSILAKALEFRINVNQNTAAADNCRIRYVIVKDLWQQGADPVGTDVFDGSTPESFRNIDVNQGRFRILCDRVVTLGPMITTNTGTRTTFESWRHFPLNYHIKYIGTLGTDATAGRGALFLLLLGTATSNTPFFNVQTRLRYYDN